MPDTHGGEDSLAPVIPLFGGGPAPTWNNTWAQPEEHNVVAPERSPSDEPSADEAELVAAAEAALVRKLRTRSLSVREARGVLVERGVDDDAIEGIIDRFVGNGYLDDARLVEQLVHSAVERKGQGRVMIGQTLRARGIPREVIDAALDDLPDDEFERALAFARQKAGAMRSLDRDTALRRLAGQLARRGYGGAALSAARQALDEAARPPARGVRFE